MSAVKSPVLFWCSMVLAVVVLWFVADRTVFLLRATHTTGDVADLSASNDRCRSGRHRYYDCTNFRAEVSFQTPQAPAMLWISAGSAHGYDRPVTQAQYEIGDPVPLVYSPGNPQHAYRDTIMDVWGAPIAAFFFQILTLISSFTERRHPI